MMCRESIVHAESPPLELQPELEHVDSASLVRSRRRRALINQLLICETFKPVFRIKLSFSSSSAATSSQNTDNRVCQCRKTQRTLARLAFLQRCWLPRRVGKTRVKRGPILKPSRLLGYGDAVCLNSQSRSVFVAFLGSVARFLRYGLLRDCAPPLAPRRFEEEGEAVAMEFTVLSRSAARLALATAHSLSVCERHDRRLLSSARYLQYDNHGNGVMQ